MANFPGTPGNDFFTLVGAPNPGNTYFGFDGDDTYLVTPFTLPAGTIANIADNKGNNTLQLNDGLQIASSNFLADAVQLTLNNGAKVIITQGASTNFKYQVGANFTINDTAPDLTFAQFASTLGAAVPGNGAAYTVPTGFSILATVEFGSTTFSAQEGNSGVKVFQIPVTISPPQPNLVTFKATTTALSATDFSDFAPFANKTITIPANTASTTIDLDVVTDTVPEPDEDLKITISNPSANIAIGSKNVVTVTILNDDANQPPTITPATATATAPTGVGVPLNVTFSVNDPDNASLTFEITPSSGSVALNGALTYTDPIGYLGNGSFTSQIKGSGTVAALSTVLSTLQYQSSSSPGSSDTVTVKVSDGVTTKTSNITVNVVQSLLLKAGNQNLPGTPGNDLFLSDPGAISTGLNTDRVVQGSDIVNGAAGNDTLLLDVADINGTPLVAAAVGNVTSIENLVIKSGNISAQTYTLQADKVGGLQKIFWQGDSGDSLTITNLDPNATPIVTTTLTKGIATLDLNNTATGEVNVVLDGGVKIGTQLKTGTLVDTVNLQSIGSGTNKVINTDANVTPTNYVITGSANLDLDTAGLDPDIENLDASAFTGNLRTKIGAIGAGGSFKGGSGNDTIDGTLAGVALNLIGNAGNDNLIGSGNNDILQGGAGNDTLQGGAGNDSLVGGDDDDSLVGGGSVAGDTIDGGKGADVITLSSADLIVDQIKLRVGDGGSPLANGGIFDQDGNGNVSNGDVFLFTGPIDVINNFDVTGAVPTRDKLAVPAGAGIALTSTAYGTTLTTGKGYFARGTYDLANNKFTVGNAVTDLDFLVVVGNGVPLIDSSNNYYTTASYFVLDNVASIGNFGASNFV